MKKVLLITLLLCSPAFAQSDGWLDTTFGNGTGYVTGPSGFFASAVAVEADGGVIVGGSSPGNDFQLVRYLSNGTIDNTFSTQGPAGLLFDFVIQPDGYIVTGGQDQFGNFLLARFYEQGGYSDSSFGNDGIVQGPQGFCSALVQQTDESIVAGGADANGNFLVIRYTYYGIVDVQFETGPQGFIEDLVIQDNGQVVACGVDLYGFFSIVRYNTDGSIDTTFGDNGIVTGPQGIATSLVIQSDGYIVVAGYNTAPDETYVMYVARYDTDGNLDGTFGSSGIVTGPAAVANGLMLQSDGKLIVLGTQDLNAFMIRLNSDGSVDSSFGASGMTTTPPGFLYGAALQANGGIVAAGLDTTNSNFLVARYTNSAVFTQAELTSPLISPVGTVTLEGTAPNPSNIFVFMDGNFIGATTTDTDGDDTWSFTTAIDSPGMYIFRALSVYSMASLMTVGTNRVRIYGLPV